MNKKIIILITILSIIWFLLWWYKNPPIRFAHFPLIKGEKIKVTNLEGFNIEQIKNSIVIIIPETELISYKNNPKWLFEDVKESWIWAWFFIDSKWTIQTVNHLVEDDKINYKVLYNNKEYNSKIISRNKEKDLATLKIISKENVLFPLLTREGARGWEKLWENVFSFWVNTKNIEIIYNTWTILNRKSKLDKISNLLEISNNIQPGFSGWPIINSKWNVIWINYAISEWKKYWIKIN